MDLPSRNTLGDSQFNQPIQGLYHFILHMSPGSRTAICGNRHENQEDWPCAGVPIYEHCMHMVSWFARTNQPQKQTENEAAVRATKSRLRPMGTSVIA